MSRTTKTQERLAEARLRNEVAISEQQWAFMLRMGDRRTAAREKGRVYKMLVRPAVMCGSEKVAPTKRQGEEQLVAEMKMLRF